MPLKMDIKCEDCIGECNMREEENWLTEILLWEYVFGNPVGNFWDINIVLKERGIDAEEIAELCRIYFKEITKDLK
jgi:hypothetical protein